MIALLNTFHADGALDPSLSGCDVAAFSSVPHAESSKEDLHAVQAGTRGKHL